MEFNFYVIYEQKQTRGDSKGQAAWSAAVHGVAELGMT